MTAKRRPSGDGTNSRRFATVGKGKDALKIPAVKDAGTFIYLTHDETWPKDHLTTVLVDARLEDEFELEEARPGYGMGETMMVKVIARKVRVVVHPGKYGQIKRLLLVTPTVSDEDLAEYTSDQVRAIRKGGSDVE